MFVVFVASHLAVLALLLACALSAGTLVLGSRDSLALRSAAGLLLCAHACFVLALIGQLRPIPLVILALLLLAALLRTRESLLPHLAVTGAGALLFVLALYPPFAFDETLYHLSFVRTFAEHGALRVIPDLRFPVFPVLHELLCVPPFLLLGDTGTHLVALAQVLITIALVAEWSGRENTHARWLAAAMFLGSPLVIQLATVLYVEIALTLCVVAGFYALDRERYAVAGLFLGSACSIKYLGVYFAFAALLLVATRFRAVRAFTIACVAAALPMTTWIFVKSGDIVFPYLRNTVWTPEPAPSITLLERAARMVRILWDVTFARDRAGLQPPITPLLIALVLLILAAAVRDRRCRILVLVSAGYLALFTFFPQDSRYLVPLLPLVSIAAPVIVATRWPHAVRALTVLACLPGLAYAAYRIHAQGVPPSTQAQQSAWIAARVPEYRALQRAGAGRVYTCGGERLKSYAAGELLGDHTGPHSYARILRDADSTRAIVERLRTLDVDYFLVAKRICASPQRDGGMQLVYEDAAAELWRMSSESSSSFVPRRMK